MSDSDSENIANIMERDSASPPEKRITFQVNQNAGRSEMSPSCAFDVYPDSRFTDSSQSALSKKVRQQRYREQHREELKQLEAERRKRKQNVPFQPTTSCSDFNSTEHVPHNENSSENYYRPIVTLIPAIVPLEASTATVTEITNEAIDNID